MRKTKKAKHSWFVEGLLVCDIDEVAQKCSIFGNSFFKITAEQLELLKQGKVLYEVDEYGTFIILETESEPK